MGKEVTAMIMEPGKLTEHSLGTIEKLKLKITHNEKELKLKRDDILQKIFTERNWHGKAKHHYVFYKLNKDTLEPIGLEEFNPYKAISAEEADIMVHENITLRGMKNLVTKIKGKSTMKLWMLLIIFIVIISVVYLKAKGMI